MLKIEKQGKVKGRGTGRVETPVCTRGWRGTRPAMRGAGCGTPRGTGCGTGARSVTTDHAGIFLSTPGRRR